LEDLPKFSALINMTTLVQELPNIDGEDVFMTVLMTDHIDQDQNNTEIICYYLAKFIVHNDKNYVLGKSITFSGYQKALMGMDSSSKISWESDVSDESNKTVSFAETIEARFNSKVGSKTSSTIKPSQTNPLLVANTSSITNPSLVANALSATNSSLVTKLPSAIRSSSVIESSYVTKSSSVNKPSTRTRSKRKLSDLAKDMLTDSTELDQSE
ncbi:16127_t:CDS:2, partial [Cetraspora pellucida]